MKKLVAITCIVVLCLSFAVTALTPPAEAGRPCIQTCINDTLLICCPVGSTWDCWWGGYCDWAPEPPW
ncbi:MAG: hypothetical protein JSW64_07210 [Candidatus Zixiibacteriota bacterium]|nr:MAG: hypothetical protein JSW64_07210 [candidate division Zixibacteria bacterium]